MSEIAIKDALLELLFDLQALNKLDINVVQSISRNFDIDAEDLCEKNGITYLMI